MKDATKLEDKEIYEGGCFKYIVSIFHRRYSAGCDP